MPGNNVFLDTNIFVYAHDFEAEEKRETSRQLIYQTLQEGTGVISPQVLSEFFVTVTRKIAQPLSIAHAKREISLLSVMATVDLDATLVVRAVEMLQQWQVSYWDALILASAERAGCETLYSEDLADGEKYGTVVVCNPYR